MLAPPVGQHQLPYWILGPTLSCAISTNMRHHASVLNIVLRDPPRIIPRVLHLHHCTRVYMIPRITPRVLHLHHCTRVYIIQYWYPSHMYMIPKITPRVLHLHHCTRVYMIPKITPRVLHLHHCTRVYLIHCWYAPHMYMIPRITPRVLHLHHCTRVYLIQWWYPTHMYMIPRITPRVLHLHHCTRVYLIQCWYPPHMYNHLMTRFTGASCRIVRSCSFCSDISTDSHWVLCPFYRCLCYGSYTLHGTGTETVKQWVSVLCYIMYTLHRHRDRYMEPLSLPANKVCDGYVLHLSVCSPGGSAFRGSASGWSVSGGQHPTGMHSCFPLCPSRSPSLSLTLSRSHVVCLSH